MKSKVTRKFVGYMAIDTGMLVLADPCYIDKVVDKTFTNDDAKNNRRYKVAVDDSIKVENAIYGLVVQSVTVEGFYPVYITIESTRYGWDVIGVQIDFSFSEGPTKKEIKQVKHDLKIARKRARNGDTNDG